MKKPTHIGKYEILDELGRGGFATVYKARDPALDRTVALKVLLPYWTQDPTFEARFRREARAAANLRHPNIVTVHDAGEADGDLYIAMEYLPGRTLRKLLEKGSLTVEQTLPILEQLAAALDYAHGRDIVHRDVKPNNVIVEETGRGVQVTLMDFGLVKALSGSSVLTSQGTLLGSPEYMAPEQADPERVDEIGPATDRYALGIVAYQMLAGRVPFPGNTPATLNAHLNLPPPALCDLNPQLPPQVEQVLLKVLAKQPADRYHSARDFVAALKQAVEAKARTRQRQEQVAALYQKLQQAVENQDWPTAESLCREILALEPDYHDVPGLWTQLRQARARQQQLEKLYAQAQSKAKSASWADVQTLCQQIKTLEPGYRDTTQLLAQAGEKLREAQAQQERETRLAQLYEQARTALQRERWEEARRRCADVKALQPGYRDVDALLDQAEQGLRREQTRQETKKERQARLAQLYAQLQTAVGKKDWPEALTLGGQIQALEPGYRDVSDLIAQAHEQLHRPPSSVSVLTWGRWTGAALLALLVLFCIATLGPQLWKSKVNSVPTATVTMWPSVSLTATSTHTPMPTATLTATPTPIPTQTLAPIPTSPISLPTPELATPDENDGYYTTSWVHLSWDWSQDLRAEQRFVIFVQDMDEITVLSHTVKAGENLQYGFIPGEEGLEPGTYMWIVQVEQQIGEEWNIVAKSAERILHVAERPLETPTPVSSPIPEENPTVNDLWNFRVTEVSDSKILITVDYCYYGEYEIRLDAHQLVNGQQTGYSRWSPDRFSQGCGTITVGLCVSPENAPLEWTSDQILLEMDAQVESDQDIDVYSEVFDYVKTWRGPYPDSCGR